MRRFSIGEVISSFDPAVNAAKHLLKRVSPQESDNDESDESEDKGEDEEKERPNIGGEVVRGENSISSATRHFPDESVSSPQLASFDEPHWYHRPTTDEQLKSSSNLCEPIAFFQPSDSSDSDSVPPASFDEPFLPFQFANITKEEPEAQAAPAPPLLSTLTSTASTAAAAMRAAALRFADIPNRLAVHFGEDSFLPGPWGEDAEMNEEYDQEIKSDEAEGIQQQKSSFLPPNLTNSIVLGAADVVNQLSSKFNLNFGFSAPSGNENAAAREEFFNSQGKNKERIAQHERIPSFVLVDPAALSSPPIGEENPVESPKENASLENPSQEMATFIDLRNMTDITKHNQVDVNVNGLDDQEEVFPEQFLSSFTEDPRTQRMPSFVLYHFPGIDVLKEIEDIQTEEKAILSILLSESPSFERDDMKSDDQTPEVSSRLSPESPETTTTTDLALSSDLREPSEFWSPFFQKTDQDDLRIPSFIYLKVDQGHRKNVKCGTQKQKATSGSLRSSEQITSSDLPSMSLLPSIATPPYHLSPPSTLAPATTSVETVYARATQSNNSGSLGINDNGEYPMVDDDTEVRGRMRTNPLSMNKDNENHDRSPSPSPPLPLPQSRSHQQRPQALRKRQSSFDDMVRRPEGSGGEINAEELDSPGCKQRRTRSTSSSQSGKSFKSGRRSNWGGNAYEDFERGKSERENEGGAMKLKNVLKKLFKG